MTQIPKRFGYFCQAEICQYLVTNGSLHAEVQRAIDLLPEYRAALISAAVTGQIDVRGLASTSEIPLRAMAESAPRYTHD